MNTDADEMIRTFIACEVPESVKIEIDRTVSPLRSRLKLAWTKPAGWHLTLKFLGDLTQDEVQHVAEAAQEIAPFLRPFTARLKGWGAFPNRKHPRVLWLGTEQGADRLAEAASALDGALVKLGYERETRKFHPHLTIARVRSPEYGGFDLWNLEHQEDEFAPFEVDRMIVFRSILHQHGAEYQPLAECFFG